MNEQFVLREFVTFSLNLFTISNYFKGGAWKFLIINNLTN